MQEPVRIDSVRNGRVAQSGCSQHAANMLFGPLLVLLHCHRWLLTAAIARGGSWAMEEPIRIDSVRNGSVAT
jgi:hypothetical protein